MGSSYKYLRGSDGTGNAVLAHITSPRSISSTVLIVDSLSKWSPYYIVTTGTLDVNGYMTPSSMTEMYAHTNAGQIIIDGFVPGYSDVGNTASQVAIVKPTNHFANSLVDQALVGHGDDGTHLPTALDSFYKFSENILDFVVPGGAVLTGTGYGTTLAWNLTAGVVYINGMRYTVAAASGVVVASKDTYFDLLATTPGQPATLVYTGGNSVANNAASPALAANSLRLGIIQSAATITAAAAINQGQDEAVVPIASGMPYAVSDSLGNRICRRSPTDTRLGMQKGNPASVLAIGYTTYATIKGISRGKSCKVDVRVLPGNGNSGANRSVSVKVQCDGVDLSPSITAMSLPLDTPNTAHFSFAFPFRSTPAAGAHTWTVQMNPSGGSSVVLQAYDIEVTEP